jgi:dihydroorotase
LAELTGRARSKEARVVLAGGTVIDELGERRADVLVEGSSVALVSERIDPPRGAMVLDAGGCLVAPGLVDLHAHLREPGGEAAETVESGSRAAALGGFTAVVAMPNTDPPVDDASVVEHVRTLSKSALCHVEVAGCITEGRRGERLAALGEMARAGVRMFTDDGSGVQDGGLMRRAMEYAGGLGVLIAEHCEDSAIAAGGHMHEGACSSALGVPGVPSAAEEAMAARDLLLARATGARLHLMHVSSSLTVEMARQAKLAGARVSLEATPHHLVLLDSALSGFDPVFKVNPPLRPAAHVAALRRACREGVVDAIATDHAPHPKEAKEVPLIDASPGMTGLETALAVAVGALCRGEPAVFGDEDAKGASLAEVLALMSWRPARVAGISRSQGGDQGGPIEAGAPANLFVLDPSKRWEVHAEHMASLSSNTPFEGWELIGAVRHTVYRGEPVVVDGMALR